MRCKLLHFASARMWVALSFLVLFTTLLRTTAAAAATAAKSHVITFGKTMPVKWFTANDETQPRTMKIRPLLVDGRVKEYTLGSTHEVTERLFVVQRAFRLNDSLPEDSGAPRW